MSWDALRHLGVTVRPIDTWPGDRTREPARAQFSAPLWATIDTLDRELRHLRAERIVLQLDVTEADLRVDGFPRANARLASQGVALAFDSRHGPLRYATDAFTTWQANLRAIALSMEALRKVDRYGVSKRGEQYRGWRALPERADELTVEQARDFLAEHGGSFREAARTLHPDRGGDRSLFERAVQARAALEAAGEPA